MKQLFILEDSGEELNDQNFFQKIIKKINQIIFDNDESDNIYLYDKRASLIRGDNISRKSSVNNIWDNNDPNTEKIYNAMINAYVHPAEKNQTVNPIQIWNDAYTYMKTNAEVTTRNKDKICREYSDIIKPMNKVSYIDGL